MKIAYMIQGTFNSGGGERVLSIKANWLANNGYDVTIVTVDQDGRMPFYEFDSKIRHIDLEVNFASTNGQNVIVKTLGFMRMQKQFRDRFTQIALVEKFDIIVSMFGFEVYWLPELKDGSKKVAETHFSKLYRMQLKRKGLWWLSDKVREIKDAKAIKRYNKFVVLTNEDKPLWGKANNIEVISNPLTSIPTAYAKLDNKVVAAVGRLNFLKGFDMLIDAWRIVQSQHGDWVLKIFGGGEDYEFLTKKANGLNIEFCGVVKDVQREYLDSSIYTFTSRCEGFGMTLAEAMSCGVPAVSFACQCGPRDIIGDNEGGILVDPGNVEMMAKGILTLIEDSGLRKSMGKKAKESIEAKYSLPIIMNKWDNLFKSIIISK